MLGQQITNLLHAILLGIQHINEIVATAIRRYAFHEFQVIRRTGVNNNELEGLVVGVRSR